MEGDSIKQSSYKSVIIYNVILLWMRTCMYVKLKGSKREREREREREVSWMKSILLSLRDVLELSWSCQLQTCLSPQFCTD